jgi:TRAP-type C4-dicarboxylate transport system permease small subunit
MLRFATGILMSGAKLAAAASFATMIVLTLVQVVNRYAFGFPLFWTEELVVFLLVWSMLLGLPVQLWQHEEIVVDVLPTTNPLAKRAKEIANLACSVVFCGVLCWAGITFAQRGAPVTSPALGLSRFWFFLPIPLSAALSILALLVRPKGESVGGFD